MIRKVTIPTIIIILLVLCLTLGTKNVVLSTTTEDDSIVSIKQGDSLVQTWMPNNHRFGTCAYYLDLGEGVPSEDTDYILNVSTSNAEMMVGENIIGHIVNEQLIFDISKVKAEPGKQYRFLLSIENESDGNGLQIKTNSKGYGAYLNDTDLNSVVRMDFNNNVFRNWAYAIVILLIFSSIAVLVALYSHRTYAETIGLSIISIGILMYLFGIVDRLSWGYKVTIGIAVIALGLIIVECIRGRYGEIEQILWSPGFILFSVILMLTVFYNRPGVIGLVYGDEFSYWGRAAKDMYYFDSLSAHINSTVDSNLFRYVPFMTILQYFFLNVAGSYNDAYLYIAYQIAGYALLMPVLGELKGEKCNKRNVIVVSVIVILAPLIFSNCFYSWIYIDAFLGIIGGYVLLTILKDGNTRFGRIASIIGSMALVLTKEMGCVLVVCIAIIVLFDVWKKEEKHSIRQLVKNYELQTLIMVCVVGMVAFGSYKAYTEISTRRIAVSKKVIENSVDVNDTSIAEINDIESQSEVLQMAGSSLGKIKNFLVGNSEDYQRESFNRMFEILFTESMTGNKLPYVDLLIVIMSLAFLWHDRGKGNNYLLVLLGATAGFIIYVGTLFFMYISVFPREDAVRWGSAGRYIDSYITMILVAIGSLFVAELVNRSKEVNPDGFIVLVFLMGLIIYVAPVNTELSNHVLFNKYLNMSENKHFPALYDALRCAGKEGDKVLYLNMADKDDGLKFRGTMVPFITGEISDSNEASFDNISKYDYVYLQYDADEHPISKELFENGEIVSGAVYSVNKDFDGKLSEIIDLN